jgi:hypothetical protein
VLLRKTEDSGGFSSVTLVRTPEFKSHFFEEKCNLKNQDFLFHVCFVGEDYSAFYDNFGLISFHFFGGHQENSNIIIAVHCCIPVPVLFFRDDAPFNAHTVRQIRIFAKQDKERFQCGLLQLLIPSTPAPQHFCVQYR